ncbi:MAG: putative replication initiation protein [Microviridae sp.]|nr:MAG: putative replication initiation protein [Microviridae sp.]
MRCSRPGFAWESMDINPSGKRSLVFSPRNARPHSGREVPCGKCTPCKMNASRDWAVRLYHEVLHSPVACVATLTLDDNHLVERIEELRPVVKAFKMRLQRSGIDHRSHWLCEYGGKFDRAHCHAVFLNEDFRNSKTYKLGETSYGSELMDKLWQQGHVHLDIVSPSACRYVAGHNQSKILAPVRSDGGLTSYNIPARRPAIGMKFARQFASDIINLNACVVGSSETAVPKSYKKNEPELFASVIEHCKVFAANTAAVSLSSGFTDLQEKQREYSARMRLIQATEVKAWHKGAHA